MNMHQATFYSILSLAIMFGLMALFTSYRYFNIKRQAIDNALQTTNQELVKAADAVYEYLHGLENVVKKLAITLSKQPFDQKQLEELFQHTLTTNKNINSLAIAYEPFAFDKTQKLFGFIYNSTFNKKTISYDYTLSSTAARHTTAWYLKTIKNGAQWYDPLFSDELDAQLVVYGVPFYAPHDKLRQKPIGVITAAITPALFNNLIKTLSIGEAGFGSVFDKYGTSIAHPIQEYVSKGKTIAQIARDRHNSSLLAIVPQILSTASGSLSYLDDISNERATFNYRAIPGTNVYLGAIVLHSELLAPFADNLRQQIILLIFFTFATLACIVMLFFSQHRLTPICLALSTLFLVGIGLLWYTKRLFIPRDIQDSAPIVRKSTINAIATEAQSTVLTQIFQIKTGIYLTSINYPEPNQVEISGFIWQRYPLPLPTPITHDPLFSDCNRFFEKTKVATIQINHEELIIWIFSALLNQSHFNTTYFPFDEQNIRITIEHEDLQSPMLIVPDLDSYRIITPAQTPGISPRINLSKRFVIENFFTLKKIPRDIDWQAQTPSTNQYRLQFNVLSRRYLVNAITIYLLPIILALIFLHICLILIARDPTFLRTSISLAASIFLSMTLLHSALRRDVAMAGICYLEYFYILLYVVLCFVITDLLLYEKNNWLTRLITYQENRWATHLVTPCYLAIIFFITIIMFY